MLFTAAIGLLALSSPALAQSTKTRCGGKDPHDRLTAEHRQAEAEHRATTPMNPGHASTFSFDASATINVNTFVHIVTSQAKTGSYNQKMVNDQIATMNAGYGPYGIQFTLRNTSFTTNNNWAKAESESRAEYNMKSTLREGDYGDLNLYMLSDLGGGLLGVCPFPDEHEAGDETFEVDGCMIAADTMPGGTEAPYNLGGTAIHETGHWFGLLHVFQGDSCGPGGDHIVDTPRQKTSSSGCMKGKNSCPGVKGLDSIHNYMDYSDDVCYESFTSDQQTRAHRMYSKFRAAYATTY